LWVIADYLVEFAQLKRLVAVFWQLANDSGRLLGDDAEARDDHIRGDDGTVQNLDVLFNDGKVAGHANVDVAPNRGRLDDGAGADKNVVIYSQGGTREGAGLAPATDQGGKCSWVSTRPLWRRPGGCKQQPRLMKQ